MSYITGSHAFKVGLFTLFGGVDWTHSEIAQSLVYRFNFGVPVQLVQYASPTGGRTNATLVGTYAQDQWTIKNLTLNLGVRFDHANANVPAQEVQATRFTPAFLSPAIDNVPNFKDVNPRIGAAYDLFGNGRTALKASLGRYVGSVGANIALAVYPGQGGRVLTSTRTWSDANGNFQPDCDLHNFAANGECGGLDNRQFGTTQTNLIYAPDVLNGFGRREYNWQGSVSVQHELKPGVAVNVGYFRTWFGNFIATQNLMATSADYDPYCVTAPVDERLPGGGGYQICDLADITPAKFGLVQNMVTQASKFGNQSEVYDGIDATFTTRFGQGGRLQGGMNVGRTATRCVVVDKPVQFCENAPPFFRPQLKLAGVYPLPVWGLETSATFQSLPGIPIAATYVATNAQIRPSLGRDLAAGARGVATVTLVEPNTLFEDRLHQLDVRLSKIVQVGRARVRGMFDVYNIFNSSAVLNVNGSYGTAFLSPTQILGARLFKFGAQLDF